MRTKRDSHSAIAVRSILTVMIICRGFSEGATEMDEVTNIEDWVVHRFRYDRRRVAVLLGASDAAAPWLAKLRRLLPELEGRAPAERSCGGMAMR